MFKNQKSVLVVMTLTFLIALTLLSQHPFEIATLFGSIYLLRWQAGGIVFPGRFQKIAAILVLWLMGIISCSFVCPVWALYPLLLLANLVVFLLAPVTNAVTVEEKFWIQAKEKMDAKIRFYAKTDSALSVENLFEEKIPESKTPDFKNAEVEAANPDGKPEHMEFIRLAKELQENLESRRQRKNRSIFLTGLLSFFAIVMRRMPISSLLLVALLAEMVSILGAVWVSLREEPWKP